LRTLEAAAQRLDAAGRRGLQVNATGANSAVMFEALAAAGATQVELGHGLTETTGLHACEDLPELAATTYPPEISHSFGSRAYGFGGGLHIDPIFLPHDVKAIVVSEPTVADAARLSVEIPPAAIAYYGMIEVPAARFVLPGDSVFIFRIRAFVTRAYVVGIAGIDAARPDPQGIFTAQGAPASWPG